MATLAEIAKKAGVSSAVVSRIVNNDASLRVSKETRARVKAIVRELNYAPNIAAQSLRSSKSGTIAFVVHDVANPVYGEILRGAQEEAERQNRAILLGDAAVGSASNSRLAQMIGGGGVDGLILQAAGLQADNTIFKAADKNIPVVLLQSAFGTDGHLIQLPDTEATSMATQHLWDLGHRKIGCLATKEALTFTRDRLTGWRNVMGEEADDSLVVYSAPLAVEGETAALELIERHSDMTAMVCFNVIAAVGALRAARARGIAVPEKLSIIAIHDVKFAGDLWVPLTVVRMPLSALGEAAMKAVCNTEPAERKREVIDARPTLVLRESTAPR